jgi:anti-sigma factor RsiW
MLGRFAERLRFMRDHRWTPRHASEYIDGELDPDARRRVERHASVCPECHALVASLGSLIVILRGFRRKTGQEVAAAVLAGVREELRDGRDRST